MAYPIVPEDFQVYPRGGKLRFKGAIEFHLDIRQAALIVQYRQLIEDFVLGKLATNKKPAGFPGFTIAWYKGRPMLRIFNQYTSFQAGKTRYRAILFGIAEVKRFAGGLTWSE